MIGTVQVDVVVALSDALWAAAILAAVGTRSELGLLHVAAAKVANDPNDAHVEVLRV